MITLPLARYRATFTGAVSARFSDFPGSAGGGARGHALQRMVCVTPAARRASCLLYQSCTYPYLFDTPPAPGAAKMRRYETVPHPYILSPSGSADGDTYSLCFAIIGHANPHLPV